jgi:hypothetical protein
MIRPARPSLAEVPLANLSFLGGDVVIEGRAVEGHAKPEMVARCAIDAVPAIAVSQDFSILENRKCPGVGERGGVLAHASGASFWTMSIRAGHPGRGREPCPDQFAYSVRTMTKPW